MKTIAQKSFLPLIAMFGFALGVMFMFTGCQTMKGAGKDIERAGEKIQENADNHN